MRMLPRGKAGIRSLFAMTSDPDIFRAAILLTEENHNG
jgi:hypothetical protein